jgi:O-antigen ligase
MLGPTLAATVYGILAIAAAVFLSPRQLQSPATVRALIFWFLSTPILFLLPATLLAFAVCGVILAALAPARGAERAVFYFMTVAAVPSDLFAAVPFPGINYLVELDFARTACLVLLAPVLMFAPTPPVRRYAPAVGLLLAFLAVYFSIQEFRTAPTLTSGLRASAYNFLLLLIPYAALVRLLPSPDDIEKVFAGFIMLAMMFFFAAVISQLTSWNYYTFILDRAGHETFADFRYGFLRVSVTLIPVLVGFVMILGLVAVEYFAALKRMKPLAAWLLRLLFFGGLIITFARGAWLAGAAAAVTFLFFARLPRGLRPALFAAGALFGLPALLVFLMSSNVTDLDQFGTFAYRQELLRASLIQIRQEPIFGDANYLASGNFDHLYQGWGIIDVVNHYLQIVLEYGLLGLSAYLLAFALAVLGLLGLGAEVRRSDDRTLELRRAALLAVLFSYLVMMGTVSAVSLGAHFGVLGLALAAAFAAAVKRERREGLHGAAPSQDAAPPGAKADAGLAAGDLYA